MFLPENLKHSVALNVSPREVYFFPFFLAGIANKSSKTSSEASFNKSSPVLLQMLCHFRSQPGSPGMGETLLQDLELENEERNCLPRETMNTLGMLHKELGK